jgi:hyperosmotically inducible protein
MRTGTGVALSAFALAWTFVAAGQAQSPNDPTTSDSAMSTEIEHRLSADAQVNVQTIKIDVRGGVVTLSGSVPAEDAKNRAGKLAAAVPGVVDVRNEISVGKAGARGEHGQGPIPEKMQGAH